MLIIDFTGIYENEGFTFHAEGNPRSLLRLNDVTGTNCICDDFAWEKIKERLMELDKLPYIRFFDSGNYHYMSKVLMDVMNEKEELPEFDLVMFDHHPDMKWTSYGEILSCGSWVLNALKDIPALRKVYIIGADEKLTKEVQDEHPEYENRVTFLRDMESFWAARGNNNEASDGNGADSRADEETVRKVYISVDKDVISRDELATNWDQGEMTIDELKKALEDLKNRFEGRILAVDVCGECTPDSEDLFTEQGVASSNRVNQMICDVFSEN
jgi:arginase family enzyme